MVTLSVEAVLFDMDGTLVDSTAMVEHVWTEFAAANAVDAAAIIDFAHGRPSRDTIARFAADPARIDEWLDWIHTAEGGRFNEVVAVPGAVELVSSLPRGRWAVVTSAIHAPARERLALVGIEPPQIVIGADNVAQGKPHPEGYLAAASALGVEPGRCVVFEDTQAGALAGLAAGCAVVLVGDLAPDVPGVVARVRDLTEVSAASDGRGITLSL